ncbi:acyltransferase family protein [Salinimonas iocasae]|uniref:Acyltransferase n=1 Tax=Salinimonas iocasae TaxID=2572577 RepID=A0A5B7Y9M5_9ALTE|nr:acyltransferase family protein [Salinimonas iocasae]QCZ92158.1 acyltransferase [Salinimonas iocasae]
MNFRYDINGLRAIAVIAVVIFHFDPSWLPGGFAGVDVFFVISGFLMTSIIFRGFEKSSFSLIKFYIARANRIIPALAMLCLTVVLAGWFLLFPEEYEALGKHAASSITFISNFVYWQEAGYFDAASHEKWLLHTWSLAVEWQFYLIYPLILLALKPLLGIDKLRHGVLVMTLALLIFSISTSALWPSASYYLLATRSWELLAGGLVFLYPVKLHKNAARVVAWTGILLIGLAYAIVDATYAWPGTWAIVPVLGTAMVIMAGVQNSWLTNNWLFQPLGRWSYSIYLWHWPLVVFGYRYDIAYWWVAGIILSVVFGFLSYRFIENIRWQRIESLTAVWRAKPVWIGALAMVAGLTIMTQQGLSGRFTPDMQSLLASMSPSPYREKCHIDEYDNPRDACEYENENVTWAVFGDSHSVELAYALAKRLDEQNEGIKHYTFSGCAPSLLQENGTSRCTRWYKEAVADIISDDRIDNVLINHRYSWTLFGDHIPDYPAVPADANPERTARILRSFDAAINKLASHKSQVVIMYPVPEIARTVPLLVASKDLFNESTDQVIGTSKAYYQKRNAVILKHLNSANYPDSVKVIRPGDTWCDEAKCYAVNGGKALYFDSNHPSVYGAQALISLMPQAWLDKPGSNTGAL